MPPGVVLKRDQLLAAPDFPIPSIIIQSMVLIVSFIFMMIGKRNKAIMLIKSVDSTV